MQFYRRLESGGTPTLDVTDKAQGRRDLEAMIEAAGLQNVIIALARYAGDKYEAMQKQDPVVANCWLESAKALFKCDGKLSGAWPPTEEMREILERTKRVETSALKLGRTLKNLFR